MGWDEEKKTLFFPCFSREGVRIVESRTVLCMECVVERKRGGGLVEAQVLNGRIVQASEQVEEKKI